MKRILCKDLEVCIVILLYTSNVFLGLRKAQNELWLFSRELGEVFGELCHLIRELPEVIRELWHPFLELPDLPREFQDHFGELPGIIREFWRPFLELPDLFREFQDHFRELPGMLRRLGEMPPEWGRQIPERVFVVNEFAKSPVKLVQEVAVLTGSN